MTAFPDALLPFFNRTLANPLLDTVMPWLSGNAVFFPALLVAAVLLLWKGGRRERIYVLLMIAVILLLGDAVAAPLKKWVLRPRPYSTWPDLVRHVPGTPEFGGESLGSMPSAHSMNWAAITVVTALFFGRRWLWLSAAALAVGISRLYLGVHYPSDVLAGWGIGLVGGLFFAYGLDLIWRSVMPHLLPAVGLAVPRLLPDTAWGGLGRRLPGREKEGNTGKEGASENRRERPGREAADTASMASVTEATWWRAGWLLIGAMLLIRLIFIGSGKIELSEDEAYQWLWARHLDIQYYSKPPLIAWFQWLGTALWGDTEFGVRFFAPTLAALLTSVLYIFVRKETGVRSAFWFLIALLATPLFEVGATLFTIDSPSVFFSTLTVVTAWRAIERDSTRWWLACGGALAGAWLAKMQTAFLVPGLVLALAIIPTARVQLRRPGFYLALALTLLAMVPFVVWNMRHEWITMRHVAERGGLTEKTGLTWRFLPDFFGAIAGLMNPVFFLAAIAAVVGFLRREKPPLFRFLLIMAAPAWLIYTGLALHSRPQPNWIAAAVPPLFLFAWLFWHDRLQMGSKAPKRWMIAGLAVGLPVLLLARNPNLIERAHLPLPDDADPLARLRGNADFARKTADRLARLRSEGRPAFIVTDHYSRAAVLSFYMKEAKSGVPDHPLVYTVSTDHPQNQFWFWPGYAGRKGENALYVCQTDKIRRRAPDRLLAEFESVEPVPGEGVVKCQFKGKTCRRVQYFLCRGKK